MSELWGWEGVGFYAVWIINGIANYIPTNDETKANIVWLEFPEQATLELAKKVKGDIENGNHH